MQAASFLCSVVWSIGGCLSLGASNFVLNVLVEVSADSGPTLPVSLIMSYSSLVAFPLWVYVRRRGGFFNVATHDDKSGQKQGDCHCCRRRLLPGCGLCCGNACLQPKFDRCRTFILSDQQRCGCLLHFLPHCLQGAYNMFAMVFCSPAHQRSGDHGP